jgi:hypothetical protein
MNKSVLASLLLLALAGCVTPHEYVDPVDPNVVTLADLENHAEVLETHYQTYNQVEGIIWQSVRSDPSLEHPDRYGSGGDSCIFGGHKLAADVFRFGVTQKNEDLDKVLQSLRGIYILTHITGTPGVMCRAAFPADQAEKWGYPERWAGRRQQFIHTSQANVPDPFQPGATFPSMVYYTRATKDQLTGLLFGLTVAWELLPDSPDKLKDQSRWWEVARAKEVIAQIVEDVYNQLRRHDFKIRDENGINETNADGVDGLMLLQLLAIYKETVFVSNPSRARRIHDKYQNQFSGGFFTAGDIFHRWNNYSQYYAWNLRYLRGYTVYILENSTRRRGMIKKWYEDRLWQFTKGHLNAKFIFLYNAVTLKNKKLDDALFAMKSLKLKPIRGYDSPLAGDERKPGVLEVLFGDWDRFILPPHLRKPTSYSTWQKEPWDVGSAGHKGREDATGVDFLLSYWLARYYGFIPS